MELFALSAHHFSEIIHVAASYIQTEKKQSPYHSLFLVKVYPTVSIVSSHSLISRLLEEDRQKFWLMKACDEGNAEYLEEHLIGDPVMSLFQHVLSRDNLARSLDRIFIHGNQSEERACPQKEALKKSLAVIYAKASASQKCSIVFHLYNENKSHLLASIGMSDNIVIALLDFLLKHRQIQGHEEVFNVLFMDHVSAIVERFSDHPYFLSIFHYLDNDVKLKVVLALFQQGKGEVFEHCLKDPQVASDTFFALFFDWRKYEKFEEAEKLLEKVLKKINLEKFRGQMLEQAECYAKTPKKSVPKSVHIAIHASSTPALFPHLERVLPLISDYPGLIQIACEHGNIKALDFLMQRTGVKTFSTSCFTNSARLGHIAVVERFLSDPKFIFTAYGTPIPISKVVLCSLINVSIEDEGAMVSVLLEWIDKNMKQSIPLALKMVLDQAAENRKDRNIGYCEPRRALLALHTFCRQKGYQLSISDLEKAKELAEIDAADEKSAQIIQSWMEEINNTH